MALKKLTDAGQLDWAQVRRSAHIIDQICNDAAYGAPEDLTKQRKLIQDVCRELDKITGALLLTPPEPLPW